MNRVEAGIRLAVVAAMVTVIGTPGVGSAATEGAADVALSMSNFRYCAGTSCSPTDQGYVRTEAGPVPGSDNPGAIVDVPSGATVRWIYREKGLGSCDEFEQCPGHNVKIEDGSAKGKGLGFAKARSGETTITTTIDQPAGTLIRYFCSVNDHDRMGMTGILRVT